METREILELVKNGGMSVEEAEGQDAIGLSGSDLLQGKAG